MAKFVVVYQVKYSEQWCADECNWIEEIAVISAKSKRAAQREFRNRNATRERYIIGRHVSTRRVRS